MDKIYSGVFVSLIGVLAIVGALMWELFLLIYGVPIFVIGIIILVNKKEDKIEKVNYKKRKGGN